MGPTRTLRSQTKASSTLATKSAKSGATKSATKASSKAAPAESAAAAAQLSSTSLLKHSQQTTDEWYKAARNKERLCKLRQKRKKWLEEWTSEGRLDDEISADAFDVIGEHTPSALRALNAYKCEHLERSFASAEGIRFAFKDYFERVCGCRVIFGSIPRILRNGGESVFQSGFKTYYESLKNRHNRTGTATQALPMLPADLKHLHFGPVQDVKMDLRSKTGIPYHEFSHIFRKTNKDPTKGTWNGLSFNLGSNHLAVQKYMVQFDKVHPEIDCYTHVKAWKVHMEGLLRRSLTGNDFVFPALASTGQVKFGEPTSRSAFGTLLNAVVEKSDALHGRNGLAQHCQTYVQKAFNNSTKQQQSDD
ncbi:hypothetical protein R3P38DRAFT_2813325 [Favolaschia claudopus]|uniref:Uncharacterized protein n=1 Tax=Favolaschia claudopus TaxID=2862362 RepID=A0AAV9Z658_9AGAR